MLEEHTRMHPKSAAGLQRGRWGGGWGGESRDGATAVLHGGRTDAFFLAELLGLRIKGVSK